MALWVNRTVGQGGRNGTNQHTISFTAATDGALLVAIVGGPVTHVWPGGWTERLQPVNGTELSVATKVASAGESSVTVTHNGSNYPIHYLIYEFPVGSTWVGGIGNTGLDGTVTNHPTLTGLSGSPVTVFYALDGTHTNNSVGVTGVWASPAIEDYDVDTPGAGTDGSWLSVAYTDNVTSTSSTAQCAVDANGNIGGGVYERVTFAIEVASGADTEFVGTAGVSTAITGAISVDRPFSSSGNSSNHATGALGRDRGLQGISEAATSASGTLERLRNISGSVNVAVGALGELTNDDQVLFVASAGISAAVTGALGVARVSSGSISAATGASGSLIIAKSLSGSANVATWFTGGLLAPVSTPVLSPLRAGTFTTAVRYRAGTLTYPPRLVAGRPTET